MPPTAPPQHEPEGPRYGPVPFLGATRGEVGGERVRTDSARRAGRAGSIPSFRRFISLNLNRPRIPFY